MLAGASAAVGVPVWLLALAACALVGLATSVRGLARRVRALEAGGRARPPRKPDFIVVMRHGESEANVDHLKYTDVGDPNVELTARGRAQALAAGDRLADLFGCTRPVFVYVSPYMRTRQTAELVLSRLVARGVQVCQRREDPRIREREFCGTFQQPSGPDRGDENKYSRFFWRPETGESCADVYDRISLFLDTLWRDILHPNSRLQGGAILIVSHGLTVRLFLMRWLHWTIETFQSTRNPSNGRELVLELQPPDPTGADWYRLNQDSCQALGLDKGRSASVDGTGDDAGAATTSSLEEPDSPSGRWKHPSTWTHSPRRPSVAEPSQSWARNLGMSFAHHAAKDR